MSLFTLSTSHRDSVSMRCRFGHGQGRRDRTIMTAKANNDDENDDDLRATMMKCAAINTSLETNGVGVVGLSACPAPLAPWHPELSRQERMPSTHTGSEADTRNQWQSHCFRFACNRAPICTRIFPHPASTPAGPPTAPHTRMHEYIIIFIPIFCIHIVICIASAGAGPKEQQQEQRSRPPAV